jgi:hypothetical protein
VFEAELDPEVPLPPLQEAMLDDTTLNQLFFDVAHAAELVSISLKGASTAHASESADPRVLDVAQRLLIEGGLLGVQLRYRYQGSSWLDTLLRTPGGVRLVRLRQDDVLAGVNS